MIPKTKTILFSQLKGCKVRRKSIRGKARNISSVVGICAMDAMIWLASLSGVQRGLLENSRRAF
jgi:hypothetical protein